MLVGQTLDRRYQIVKRLGGGGFGDTYLAEDLRKPKNSQCVVKHLKPTSDPNAFAVVKRLFYAEVEKLDELGHECDRIPNLYAHFEENGQFMVQEFIDGTDLSGELPSGEKCSEDYVIKLLREILEVLAVVHQHNVIHRDIKPQNLMRRRKDGKIILIDFGAVKQVGTTVVNASGQTSFTIAIGTPGYMPAEQAQGKPKLCSDVYAIGIVGIQALTGLTLDRLSENSATGEIIWRNQANVSSRLADIIDTMVRAYFPERYKTATEALQALQLLSPTPTVSQSQPIFSPSPLFSVPAVPQPIVGKNLQIFEFEIFTFDRYGREAKRRRGRAQMEVVRLKNGVTLEMVRIPGGKFVMGSPNNEAGRSNIEGAQHEVTVPEFFIGRYAVTQAQWEAVMRNNPSSFKGANRPVECLSWNEAVEFCQKLSQMMGKSYRLPSEAEWEYACRAGTTTPFHFGETIMTDFANYNGEYNYADGPKGKNRKQTVPVGTFPPNAFGVYEMHGNVWEWCADNWHNSYKNAPIDGSIWLTSDKYVKLLRGGSWYDNPGNCRSAFRDRYARDVPGSDLGFRVVSSS